MASEICDWAQEESMHLSGYSVHSGLLYLGFKNNLHFHVAHLLPHFASPRHHFDFLPRYSLAKFSFSFRVNFFKKYYITIFLQQILNDMLLLKKNVI